MYNIAVHSSGQGLPNILNPFVALWQREGERSAVHPFQRETQQAASVIVGQFATSAYSLLSPDVADRLRARRALDVEVGGLARLRSEMCIRYIPRRDQNGIPL